MNGPGTITGWLDGLRAGDEQAAQRLWEEYFHRLVGLARARLGGRPRGPMDEEDVALNAFDTFCRGAQEGRFPRLADRQDLWQVLVMLTARKAVDADRRERARKRGGNPRGPAADDGPRLEELVGREPTPSFAAGVVEELCRLLDTLDPGIRAVALLKLEGLTNPEIARRLGRSRATIERKLQFIRLTWMKQESDG
ncbi:MAG TPA: ECF-type sigma factor [Gemmataceae bacterium]|nr:ECF-type sigma factor [Gemmataceae bacterium]